MLDVMPRARIGAAVAAGVAVAAFGAAGSLAAQDDLCDRHWGSSDQERYCEVRETTVEAGGSLDIDGGMNGGVEVVGTNRRDVRVFAEVWAYARSESRAQEITEDIDVRTSGDRIRADGPSQRRGQSWGVNWVVEVPFEMDLDIDTHNGGISIADVDGTIRFDALNGGVRLDALAGDVQGHTTNGGLRIELDGDRWDGQQLDVKTTNGGVEIWMPEGYSADFETGTVNGGMQFDIPITVRGRVDRRIRTQLGDGGPTVRAVTTNGGVKVRRAR